MGFIGEYPVRRAFGRAVFSHALYNKMWIMTNIIDNAHVLRYNQIN